MTHSPHQDTSGSAATGAPPRFSLRRLLPLLAIVVVAGILIAGGAHRHLSFETLARYHGEIGAFIGRHFVGALLAYVALYIAVVALSIPGALFLTVTGGILFGVIVGGTATVIAATIGATAIFLIAKSALGEHLVRRAGATVDRIAQGFRDDAFHYLLFLRLVPLFPFWLVNIVPALAGVRVGIFVAATAIGIIPGTFAYTFFGAGLDSVMVAQGAEYRACLAKGLPDCQLDFSLKSAVTPELIAAFVVLGIVALIPVVVKRIRERSRAVDSSA